MADDADPLTVPSPKKADIAMLEKSKSAAVPEKEKGPKPVLKKTAEAAAGTAGAGKDTATAQPNIPITEIQSAKKEENVRYIEKRLPLPNQVSEEAAALALLQQQNSTDLTLTFNRNSWVDIRDSTGKHLIRKLGIAGNTQKVTGVAPFQVLLGYGHGVTIEYNGNQVDFSAFQGDRVARFTLEVPKEKVDSQ